MDEEKIDREDPLVGGGALRRANWATSVFIGEGGMRAGWRLLIYFTMLALGGSAVNFLLRHLIVVPKGPPTPAMLLLQEVLAFLLVFGCALLMSKLEGRSGGEYGLPIQVAFGGKFWIGVLLGLAEISLLIGLIAAFGGYSFGSLVLHGAELPRWAFLYVVIFLFVGFFEEFLFRGYTQFTLGDGIGFWPAAWVLSLLFGAGHLSNPGEGVVGALSVLVVGLYFAFTLKRTGNLWFAVGLHASFDWGESFLFSVPDSGLSLPGHLSSAALHGPKWLTGGTVGPEGSVFCFLTMGLQFLVVMWLFPAQGKNVQEQPAAQEKVA
jgi:membrane protease YdiL (CAAX protease family)